MPGIFAQVKPSQHILTTLQTPTIRREKMKQKKRYIYDTILIALLLVIFLSLFFFFRNSDTGATAVVYIENDVVAEYPLSIDGEYEINNGTNILKIENGKAYMLYAECPDGWCKNQGKIYLSGERITCLPNRVMIVIEEGEG